MKPILLKFLLIPLLFMMANCKSQKITPDQFQRQWMLVSFKDYTKEFLTEKKAYLDFNSTKNPANQYSAYMGCNGIMVNADINLDGTVKIGDLGATEMHCEDNQGLEKKFIYEIAKMKNMKIEGHQMTLTDGEGSEMKFVAADWD